MRGNRDEDGDGDRIGNGGGTVVEALMESGKKKKDED